MLTKGKPDIVIAFPGGSGTADMICQARKAGVPVEEIK
jgi:predicted Rossmann-fold nucleotide-binding protein